MQIKSVKLGGVYTALITPMHEDGSVDFGTLRELVENQIEADVDGILACGTTGQSATLSHEEHVDLVETIFDYIGGRKQFIANAGSNCTREAVELSNEVERRIGPTTLLHVTGYYNNPPQEGLLAHYRTIADNLSFDESNMILYNVPGRTGSNIEAETAIELAYHPNIIGLKEASGDIEQVEKIIEGTNEEEFRVLSGEDDIVADVMEIGGYGVVSASANVAPGYFARIVWAGLEGDYKTAHDLQEEVNPLVRAVFCVKNPIPLAHMFNTNVRLPLIKVDRAEREVRETLNKYNSEDLGIDLSQYQ